MFAVVEMTEQRISNVTLHTTEGEAVRKAMALVQRSDTAEFLRELRAGGFVTKGKNRVYVAETGIAPTRKKRQPNRD